MLSYINTKLELEFNRLSLWYFVSFLFGIVFYFSLSFEPSMFSIGAAAVVSLVSIALTFIKDTRLLWRFLTLILTAFVFGIVASKYRMTTTTTSTIEHTVITTVTGKVDSIKPTIRGSSIILSDVKGKYLSGIQKIKISLPAKYNIDLSLHDTIELRTKLYPPQTQVLPNSYDFGMYSYFAQIGATGYAMSQVNVITKSPASSGDIIFDIRNSIYRRLIDVMGKDAGNFEAAILLGETKGIDKSIMQNMRQAGISHILCVSGLHVSLVTMLFFISIRVMLNLSDYIAFNFNIKLLSGIGALIGAYGYLLLTGSPVAATRAFIMTSLFILAMTLDRSPYPIRSIGVASFIILCLNPEYVFHPSFQLSFIAVLSLVAGYEFYQKNNWILGRSSGLFGSIKFYFASNVYSSFLASIVTAPVVINQFYIFSTYSIFSNLIAVPITSFFLMPLSIIGIMLMPFGMDRFIFLCAGFCIEIIVNLANYTNTLTCAVWYFGYITPLSITVFLLGFFWLCFWETSWRLYGILIMIISCVLMFNSPKPDLMFDPVLNIVGLKNKENKLEIYAGAIPEFNKTYWSNWFGQKEVKVTPLTSNMFIMANGYKIVINHRDLSLKNSSEEKILIIEPNQKTTGVILVFCDDSLCHVESKSDNRF